MQPTFRIIIEIFTFSTENNYDVTFLFACVDKFEVKNSVKELSTLELNYTNN